MTDKKRGLGRGLGALIPTAQATAQTINDRPVDVFFPEPGADPISTNGVRANRTADAAVDEQPSGAAAPPRPRASNANSTDTGPGDTDSIDTDSGDTDSGDTNSVDTNSGDTDPVGAGSTLVSVPGAVFAEVLVSSIAPNPRQPRQAFDEEELAELVASIREVGVLQPVVVRPVRAGDSEQQYELVMGERRWRASRDAGLSAIPAIIRDTADDALLRDALLENLHRAALNPLEEAAAYQQLLEDFGCTHDELATRLGRSRPQISNTIRLLKLPAAVQRRVAAGVLSAGHARALLALDDAATMERLASRVVTEGLSVRAIEEIVSLGDEPTKAKPRRPRAGGHTAEMDDLATRLGDRLDTRVSIALGRSRGRLTIEFASVEDLNRIVSVMSPDDRGAFASRP